MNAWICAPQSTDHDPTDLCFGTQFNICNCNHIRQDGILVTPSLYFASHVEDLVGSYASRACRRQILVQYRYSQFWSLHIDSLTACRLYLIGPNCVSFLLQVVEAHRIDLQREDDNVEVQFSTGRVFLHWQSLRIITAVSFSNQRVSLSFECLGSLRSNFGQQSSLSLTEVRFTTIVNVSESGSHLRCCTTRSKSSCSFFF